MGRTSRSRSSCPCPVSVSCRWSRPGFRRDPAARPPVTARAGELLAVGFEGTALPEAVAALAAESGLGGIVLFRRNCPDLDTVLALTAAARRLGPDVLVLVDHEGGRVHRLPPPFTHFPPAATIGRAGDPGLAAAVGPGDGARAPRRGVRLGARAGAGLPDRSRGASRSATGRTGRTRTRSPPAASPSSARPWRKASSRSPSTFPATGARPVDSHLLLPEVDVPRTRARADRADAIPPGARSRMPGRAGGPRAIPGARSGLAGVPVGRPSSPGSSASELGFDGLVLSDDLEMAAVRDQWGVDGAAVRFLEAGGDLALVCRDAGARDATVAGWARASRPAHCHRRPRRPPAHRRRVLRAWVERTGARPDVGVIGCPEHRDLLAEVLGRGGRSGADPGVDDPPSDDAYPVSTGTAARLPHDLVGRFSLPAYTRFQV